MKGKDNFIQMMIEKNKLKQKRQGEIQEFNNNYAEDLVHKWTHNNSQEYKDKFVKINQVTHYKQSVAQYLKSGEKVGFPLSLSELQKIDEIKADKVRQELNQQEYAREQLALKKSKDMIQNA